MNNINIHSACFPLWNIPFFPPPHITQLRAQNTTSNTAMTGRHANRIRCYQQTPDDSDHASTISKALIFQATLIMNDTQNIFWPFCQNCSIFTIEYIQFLHQMMLYFWISLEEDLPHSWKQDLHAITQNWGKTTISAAMEWIVNLGLTAWPIHITMKRTVRCSGYFWKPTKAITSQHNIIYAS